MLSNHVIKITDSGACILFTPFLRLEIELVTRQVCVVIYEKSQLHYTAKYDDMRFIIFHPYCCSCSAVGDKIHLYLHDGSQGTDGTGSSV